MNDRALINEITSSATKILGGTILLILASRIYMPLPFSPVPITAQTFAVLFLGVYLGKKKGSAAVLSYITGGAMGLPFFAGGAFLSGPTAGYLIGFPIAAYLSGLFSEKGKFDGYLRRILYLCLASTPIYALGLVWLSLFVGAKNSIYLGLFPFIPGDLLKIIVLSLII